MPKGLPPSTGTIHPVINEAMESNSVILSTRIGLFVPKYFSCNYIPLNLTCSLINLI